MVTVDEVKGLKVPELKEELKALGLDVKGVKADLVKRLEDALLSKEPEPADPEKTVSSAPGTGAVVGAAATEAPAANGRTRIEFKTSTAVTKPAEAKPQPLAPAAVPAEAKPVDGLSEAERRKQRAARFGAELSTTDKLNARAARFGIAESAAANGKDKPKAGIATPSEAEKVADLEKRKERAKRFNLPVPVSAEEAAAKKKARVDRFGSLAGTQKTVDSSELQKKLAARAERFALEKKPSTEAKPAPIAVATDPEAEAKRQARAIRFAAS